MADDAGALLVRSGLVSSRALDDARARVASLGGTIGEHLVVSHIIGDDALTDFYRSRLLVPQVNPNTLARLSPKVVGTIPADMAIELRVVPVSLDGDQNLTLAMSDPSDRHAVDEIAFFTGMYIVRAVATQMQIAWCLAHYYGHVTALGQRLLQTEEEAPTPGPLPRQKGLTGRVDAMRHRAMAPVTGPVHVQRPAAVQQAVVPVGDPTPPMIEVQAEEKKDRAAIVEAPRARTASGEIRIPRAPSIKPPMGETHEDVEEAGPVITIEVDKSLSDQPPPRKVTRRRVVRTDPPELAARAGEVDIITAPVRRVDLEEQSIVISDEPSPRVDASGELHIISRPDNTLHPSTTIEIDDDTAVVIHERMREREAHPILLEQSALPILLERRRPNSDEPPLQRADSGADTFDQPLEGEEEVVVLDARKPAYQRTEKRTQIGIGAMPAVTRPHRDTETSGIPESIASDDATNVDIAALPDDAPDSTDQTAAPPSPARDDDTSPHLIAAPPAPVDAHADTADAQLDDTADAPIDEDEDHDDHEDDDDDVDETKATGPMPAVVSATGPMTAVMSAAELDAAVPERTDSHIPRRRQVDYDPSDDGWGPPGTTIPPPLLGAVPGSEEDLSPDRIPMTDVDAAPLIVAPPVPPEAARESPLLGDSSGQHLVRALETATSRAIDLIRSLEHAKDRDEVVTLMIAHLADSHRRAGFFSVKAGELGVFSMTPSPPMLPLATLRLDRPSTLQDVVGTRLPYRGPMLDDASRTFLTSALGASPPEILLVPVAVRERVVGVLFGEHRMRHTFDDQLALGARAAGMALERILKSKQR